jgi:hypothetical protein
VTGRLELLQRDPPPARDGDGRVPSGGSRVPNHPSPGPKRPATDHGPAGNASFPQTIACQSADGARSACAAPGVECKTPHPAVRAGGASVSLPGPEGGHASRHSPVPRGSCARIRLLRLRNAHAPVLATNGRDRAPGVPAVAGKPHALQSEVGRWSHKSVLDSRECDVAVPPAWRGGDARKNKIAPPMIA